MHYRGIPGSIGTVRGHDVFSAFSRDPISPGLEQAVREEAQLCVRARVERAAHRRPVRPAGRLRGLGARRLPTVVLDELRGARAYLRRSARIRTSFAQS